MSDNVVVKTENFGFVDGYPIYPHEHPRKKGYLKIGFVSKESNKKGNEFEIYYNYDTEHMISELEGFIDRKKGKIIK